MLFRSDLMIRKIVENNVDDVSKLYEMGLDPNSITQEKERLDIKNAESVMVGGIKEQIIGNITNYIGKKKLEYQLENGTDVERMRAMVLLRGDKWNDKGVNIIGLRNNYIPSGKNKYDDVFIVIRKGKIKGAFMGTADPGVAEYDQKTKNLGGVAHLSETQHEFNYIPREVILEYDKKHNTSIDKHNDVLIPNKDVLAQRDKTENGFLESTSEMDMRVTDNAGRSLWFHAGSKVNEYVKDFSLGCQAIAIDVYCDAGRGRIEYDNTSYSIQDTQTAYNRFLEMVNPANLDTKVIRYNLFNIESNDTNWSIYLKYRLKIQKDTLTWIDI